VVSGARGGAQDLTPPRAAVSPPGGASLGLIAMVAATLLWGGTFVVIRDSLHSIPPLALVIGRFAAAAALLVPLALTRARRFDRATLLGGAAAGACFAGGFLAQAVGLMSTRAGSSAFLTCAGSLSGALWAWPLLGQRPGGLLARGLLLALAGSALLSLDPAGGLGFGTGDVWTLAGAIVFGLQIVVLARFAPAADPLVLGAVQALTVVIVLLPFAGGAPAAFRGIDAPVAWRVAYLVVAGSVVAPLLQIVAQRHLPAGRVALLFALEPVFALVFALTVGGESFAARWWLGAALILTGVVWVEWDAARGGPAGAPPPGAASRRAR
jgi:drug/metabolite transporter (DMT)-like permease